MLKYWELNRLIRPFSGRRAQRDLNAPWALRRRRRRQEPVRRPPPAWIPDTDEEDLAQQIEAEIRADRLAEEHAEAVLIAEARYDEHLQAEMAPCNPFGFNGWLPDTDDEELEERMEREMFEQQRELYFQGEFDAREAALAFADEVAVGLSLLEPGHIISFNVIRFSFLRYIIFDILYSSGTLDPELLQCPGSQAANRRRAELLLQYRDSDVEAIMSQPGPVDLDRIYTRRELARRHDLANRRIAALLRDYVDSDEEDHHLSTRCPCKCHRLKKEEESPTSGYESGASPDRSLNSTTPSDDAYDEARSALLYGDESLNGGRYSANYVDGPDEEYPSGCDGSDVDWTPSLLNCPETLDPPRGKRVKQEYILPDSSGFESDTGSVEIIAVVKRRRVELVDLC